MIFFFANDHYRFISHREHNVTAREYTFCTALNFIHIFIVGKRLENTVTFK